jgi:hypothetical protein
MLYLNCSLLKRERDRQRDRERQRESEREREREREREDHLKINYRERGARAPFSFLKNFKHFRLDYQP